MRLPGRVFLWYYRNRTIIAISGWLMRMPHGVTEFDGGNLTRLLLFNGCEFHACLENASGAIDCT